MSNASIINIKRPCRILLKDSDFGSHYLGLNPSYAIYYLYNLGQVAYTLGASVCLLIKWG